MIKETYLSAKKRAIPKGDLIFDISGSGKGRRFISPLAPSPMLMEDWNNNRIRWKEYVERYFLQLYHNQRARSLLDEIISISMQRDVWLIGLEKNYPCHRFLLKQIIEKVLYERKVIASIEDYSEQYRMFKNKTKSQAFKMKKTDSPSSAPTSHLPG
ncbi:MAG: DUF488 family protein [Syntrophobacterales bacterium]|nr:MAG: DUF488 family protein [Syntrophobacterales bacterium]